MSSPQCTPLPSRRHAWSASLLLVALLVWPLAARARIIGGGSGGAVSGEVNVSDTVYGAGWNADTLNAASKNALFDKIETLELSTSNNFDPDRLACDAVDDDLLAEACLPDLSGTYQPLLDQDVNTTGNPSFLSVHASGGNLAAANAQVTKQWITGLTYTENVTSVIHGGVHYLCILTHTAGVNDEEPGIGANWDTYWVPTLTAEADDFGAVTGRGRVDTGATSLGSALRFGNLDYQINGYCGGDNVCHLVVCDTAQITCTHFSRKLYGDDPWLNTEDVVCLTWDGLTMAVTPSANGSCAGVFAVTGAIAATGDITAGGELRGKRTPISETAATRTMLATDCGTTITNADADALEVDLLADPTGCIVCFFDAAGGAITLDPDGTDTIVIAEETPGPGDPVILAAGIGNNMCLQGKDATTWFGLRGPGSAGSALTAGTLVDTKFCSYNASTGQVDCDNDPAAVGADSIGTVELDDGVDTPGSGDYLRVDTVDQAGVEYRTTAEVLSDIGAQPLDADLTDLADGSLTGTKVGFADTNNAFAATDVQGAIEELIVDNTIGPNQADAKVHWSQLGGVPAGFADGTDDGAGGGSGTVTTVKSNDVQVGGADIVTLDFSAEFGVAETPDTEVQITLDASLTRDAEWDTIGEVETVWGVNILTATEGDAAYQPLDADLTTLAAPTAWRTFYSNGTSVVTELALGASGTVLKSNGTASAPSWQADAGGVGNSLTTEIVYNNAGTLDGAPCTTDGTDLTCSGVIAGASFSASGTAAGQAVFGELAANGTGKVAYGVDPTANLTDGVTKNCLADSNGQMPANCVVAPAFADVTGEATDAQVSNTLTSSLFVGSGSTTTAIDLATAEVAGTLPVANGGTGRTTGTTAFALVATGTTATGAQQTLASGATTELLVGGGASALPVWTTATGTGAPVRATSPTLVTPALGTPSALVGTNITGTASGLTAGTATLSNATRTPTKSTATTYTIGTTDPNEAYGGVIYVTGAATITAPAVAVGMSFTVITIGAVAVSVDVNAADRMYLDGTALDDGDKATNTSTTGDLLVCTYESAAGWYCASGSNDGDLWTDTGA